MAQITVTVPDPQVERVAEGLGWSSDDEATAQEHIADALRGFLRGRVADRESSQAHARAREQAFEEVTLE